MRFEVPQFIEVEDKIFGPLTWKQFIYLAGAGGVGIVSYLALPFTFFLFITIGVATLAAFLAFYPVNNRPFSLFLESFFQYLMGVKLYLWKRESKPVYTGRTGEVTRSVPHSPPTSRQNITSLSRQLEVSALHTENK